ncbi:hypothetical protein HPP92_028899 [Vanilla planifolia]|uniref:Uncharacterized protein n=1 Tax=Vanilla planifolia TaxID=51239 RepID=A0A835U2C6_VANPL|nr:hypothetical protein HPP92_028899 [Vanilla planifolia]KAG0446319.1 hypothetical protein HPP92_028889 [Vanilla planifolia]
MHESSLHAAAEFGHAASGFSKLNTADGYYRIRIKYDLDHGRRTPQNSYESNLNIYNSVPVVRYTISDNATMCCSIWSDVEIQALDKD